MPREWLTEAELWEYSGPLQPSKPIRCAGEIVYAGWDIPDRWAIDDSGHAWATRDANGGPLSRIRGVDLMAMAQSDDDRQAIYNALGVERYPTLVERLRQRNNHLTNRIAELDREAENAAATIGLQQERLDLIEDQCEALADAAREVIAAHEDVAAMAIEGAADADDLRLIADRMAVAAISLRDALKGVMTNAD